MNSRQDSGSSASHAPPTSAVRPGRPAVAAGRGTEVGGAARPDDSAGRLDDLAARVLLRDNGLPGCGRVTHLVVRGAGGDRAALLALGQALHPLDGRAPARVATLAAQRAPAFATLPAATRDSLLCLAARIGGEPDDVTSRVLGSEGVRALVPAVAAGILAPGPALLVLDPVLAFASYLSTPAHTRVSVHEAFAAALPTGSELALMHAAEAAVAPDESLARALERMAQEDLAAARLGRAAYIAQRAAELSVTGHNMARCYATALAAATRAGDDAWSRELIAEAQARCRLEAEADIAVAVAFSLSRAGLQPDAMCALRPALVGLRAADRTRAIPPDLPRAGAPPTGARPAGASPANAIPAGAAPVDATRAPAPSAHRAAAHAAAAYVASQTGLPEHAAISRDLGPLAPAPWHLAEVDAAPRVINDLLAHGRWDEAQARVSEATARARAHDLAVLEVQTAALAATLTALRGDGRQARTMAERAWPVLDLASNAASRALLLRALGHAAFAEHDYRTALSYFSALATLHEAHQALDPVEPDLPLWVTLSAVRVGEPRQARKLLAQAGSWHRPADTRACLATTQAQALLAADDAAAEAHYQLVVTTPGAETWPFLLALGQLNYGIWLRRRRHYVRAREHLSQALTAFDALRAEGFAAATRTELNAAGATRDDPDSPRRLTPQQLAVATLAAQGLSNRLIADRMQITPRTVSAHLHSAFLRLGVSRRHLLQAALAAEPGTSA